MSFRSKDMDGNNEIIRGPRRLGFIIWTECNLGFKLKDNPKKQNQVREKGQALWQHERWEHVESREKVCVGNASCIGLRTSASRNQVPSLRLYSSSFTFKTLCQFSILQAFTRTRKKLAAQLMNHCLRDGSHHQRKCSSDLPDSVVSPFAFFRQKIYTAWALEQIGGLIVQ